MVLIESKKYACETCIKGHRSSGCKHTDRPLFEIKKKGRPVTQCEHCRELRKTKQVHVKCSCHKEELPVTGGEQASSRTKKGVNKMLESAAFPDGLPEALEASVASQLLSQGATSDSDHERCACMVAGSECNCCTLRKSVPQARKKGTLDDPTALRSSHSPNPASSSTVPARVSELRALLPKPPHDPSSSALHSIARHENKLYSPYGRAYDQSHPNHPAHHLTSASAASITLHTSAPPPSDLFADGGASSSPPYPVLHASNNQAWKSVDALGVIDYPTAGSICACGARCTCSPCRPRSEPDTRQDCCNDLTIGAPLPYQTHPDFPPDSTLPMYDNSYRIPNNNDNGMIDEWIRQMQNSIDPQVGEDSSPDILGDDSNYRELSSNMIGSIGPNPSIFANGRSRSYDDILSSGFSAFDTNNAPSALFSASQVTGPMYPPNPFDVDVLQHFPPISSSIELEGAEPRSRSTSSSEVNRSTALNAFPDFGEMSMFYHHSNGGGRGSVRSLPDTMGYF